MATEQITLYTAKVCPYAHRTELALAEAKAEFTRYEIDLSNKPEWYAPKVNPASKVPAIAYGGPKVSPDSPSPESEKIAESLVLIEFIADLYPNAKLMPVDPVKRAKARFFTEAFQNKFTPAFMTGILGYGASDTPNKSLEKVLQAFEAVQELLPAEGWAIGEEFSLADVAVAPFLGRALTLLENDLGAYEAGVGRKTYEALTNEPKYARVMKYFDDLKARESFQKTFDKEFIIGQFKKRYAEKFGN